MSNDLVSPPRLRKVLSPKLREFSLKSWKKGKIGERMTPQRNPAWKAENHGFFEEVISYNYVITMFYNSFFDIAHLGYLVSTS